jgi:hypothetical protein
LTNVDDETPCGPAAATRSACGIAWMEGDWMESERGIYTDGGGHPGDGERSLSGHSIGR